MHWNQLFVRDCHVHTFDLSAALSLFKSPILDFDEQFVTIKEENNPSNSLKYFYSDPSVVQTPSKTITMPSEEVTFEFSNSDLSKISNV